MRRDRKEAFPSFSSLHRSSLFALDSGQSISFPNVTRIVSAWHFFAHFSDYRKRAIPFIWTIVFSVFTIEALILYMKGLHQETTIWSRSCSPSFYHHPKNALKLPGVHGLIVLTVFSSYLFDKSYAFLIYSSLRRGIAWEQRQYASRPHPCRAVISPYTRSHFTTSSLL